MNTLELNQLERINGGDFWDGFCDVVQTATASAAVYQAGALVIPGVNAIAAGTMATMGIISAGCFFMN